MCIQYTLSKLYHQLFAFTNWYKISRYLRYARDATYGAGHAAYNAVPVPTFRRRRRRCGLPTRLSYRHTACCLSSSTDGGRCGSAHLPTPSFNVCCLGATSSTCAAACTSACYCGRSAHATTNCYTSEYLLNLNRLAILLNPSVVLTFIIVFVPDRSS